MRARKNSSGFLLFACLILLAGKILTGQSEKLRRKRNRISPSGYVLYYTNQCPFNAKYVPILEETAQKNGIPLKAVKIENRKDAQNVPTPITTYALFCDGEYVTNEQMNDKKFLKLVGR